METNKNRLTNRNQAADPYVRLSKWIDQVFPTYPSTAEEMIKYLCELNEITDPELLCLAYRLNIATPPKRRPC